MVQNGNKEQFYHNAYAYLRFVGIFFNDIIINLHKLFINLPKS